MLDSIGRPRLFPYTRSEPQVAMRRRRARRRAARRPMPVAAPQWEWLRDAAPFSIALLWTLVTTTALLLWALTGRRELLDSCRSDAALTGTTALVASTLLGASLRRH